MFQHLECKHQWIAVLCVVAQLSAPFQASASTDSQASDKSMLARTQELHVKRLYLEGLQRDLEALCLDKDGRIKPIQMVTKELSCVDSAVDFNNKVVTFKGEVREVEEDLNRQPAHAVKNGCGSADGPSREGNLGSLTGFMDGLKKETEKGCAKERTVSSCVRDFGCNLARTIASPIQYAGRAAGITQVTLSHIRQAWGKFDQTCPAQNSNCFEQILNGVIKALWSDITALGDLARLVKNAPEAAWTGAKKLGQDIGSGALGDWLFSKLHREDNKVLLSHQIASQLSDQELKEAKSSEKGKITVFFEKIFTSLSKSVRENYACEKFKPAPHQFECEVPLQSWACASCNSMINSICGVVGALGAEYVSTVLIGGAVGVVSTTVEAGAAFGTAARKYVILESANSSTLNTALQAKRALSARFGTAGVIKESALFQSVSSSLKNVLEKSALIRGLIKADVIFPYVARKTKDGVLYVAKSMQETKLLSPAGTALENSLLKAEAAKAAGEASTASKVYRYTGAKLAVDAAVSSGKAVVSGAGWYLEKLDQGFRLGYNIPKAPFRSRMSKVLRSTENVQQAQVIQSIESGNEKIRSQIAHSKGSLTPEQMHMIEEVQKDQLEKTMKILDANRINYVVENGTIKFGDFDGPFGEMLRNRLAERSASAKTQLARDLKAGIVTTIDSKVIDELIESAVEGYLRKNATYHPSNALLVRMYENEEITKKQLVSLIKVDDAKVATEEIKAELMKQLMAKEQEGFLFGSVEMKEAFMVKPDHLLSREVLRPADFTSVYEGGDNALIQIARRSSERQGGKSGFENAIRSVPRDPAQAQHMIDDYRTYVSDKLKHTQTRLRNYSVKEATNIANEAAERAQAAFTANGISFEVREHDGVKYFVIKPESTGNTLSLNLRRIARADERKGLAPREMIFIPGDAVLAESETWKGMRESMQAVLHEKPHMFLGSDFLTGTLHQIPSDFVGVKTGVVQDLLRLNEENKFVAKEFENALARKPASLDEPELQDYYSSLVKSIKLEQAKRLVDGIEAIFKKANVSYRRVRGADHREFLEIEKNYDTPLNAYATLQDRDVLFYPKMSEVASVLDARAAATVEKEIGFKASEQTFLSYEEMEEVLLYHPEIIEKFRNVTSAARPEAYSDLMVAVRKAARQTTNLAGHASGQHTAATSSQVGHNEVPNSKMADP